MTALTASQRLSLHAPSMGDLDALAAMWSDPETMKYIGKGVPWTRDEVHARLERAIRTQSEAHMTFWTVRTAGGQIIGQAGVVPIAFAGPEHELGYRFGREHWGHGYATEAARLAATYAFEALHLPELVAVAYPENTASRRVLEKVGFRETGTSHLYYGVTCLRFELTREDLHAEP